MIKRFHRLPLLGLLISTPLASPLALAQTSEPLHWTDQVAVEGDTAAAAQASRGAAIPAPSADTPGAQEAADDIAADPLPALDGQPAGGIGLSGGLGEDTSASDDAHSLPSLPRLFELALRNDAKLASQRYDAEATQQNVPMSVAGLKPQVSASASYLYQKSDNYYTDNPEYDPDNELSNVGDDYEARYQGVTRDKTWQVQVTQPLFSLERWRKVGKAKAQSDVAELKVAVGERDLALDVAKSYLDAFLASRKLGLLDSKEKSLELQVKQAQRAYDLGVGDRINLLESRSRLDQAVSDKLQAENELDNALSVLERFTGQLPTFTGSRLGDLGALDLQGDYGDEQQWLTRVGDNVEVQLGKQQEEVAKAETGVRRAGHYPELDLSMGYSHRDSNDPYRESKDTSATLRLNVPIYQGGYTTASVRQGELSLQSSRSSYVNALNVARQEVRKRLRSLRGDARQIEALKRSIDSSNLFLEAAERGEQLGLRDLVDVLDARADLYDQRIKLVSTIRQYLLDRLNLKAAVGALDTQDLVDTMKILRQVTG
ncbi:TolC family outer membrane protein [Salinicola sp. JS01]|uniref:TolC family outer membrane protein n=1 Tax=Salinicola sp. JS01 TaxID=3050071 RepID=UPI00255BD052|nr:TolC family outer membrane protein [Salinicola sp. JS01]WIX33789.1 TolC family outer membrane protein [Salinicola sp. JS01]